MRLVMLYYFQKKIKLKKETVWNLNKVLSSFFLPSVTANQANLFLKRIHHTVTGKLYLVWSSISIFELDVGLLPDAVQVLMQAVQKEGQQFVGVLLLIAWELRGKAPYLGLKTQTEHFICFTKWESKLHTKQQSNSLFLLLPSFVCNLVLFSIIIWYGLILYK